MSSPTTKCTESECKKLYSGVDKLNVSILAGLLFLLLSLPFTQSLIAKAMAPLGFDMLNKNGCNLTIAGLVVMALLYAIITRLMML